MTTNPNLIPGFSNELELATRADAAIIEDILQRLEPDVRDAVQVVSGVPVFEEIVWGEVADFYVCHGGTMAPKIGWMHPVPGLIHTSADFRRSLRALSPQVENGPPCFFLSESLTKDCPTESYTAFGKHRTDENYVFLDINSVLQEILSAFRSTVGPGHLPASVPRSDALARRLMKAIHRSDIYAGLVTTCREDLQGWNSEHPIFEEIVETARPRIIVDVGVWKGASTIFLASLLRDRGIDGAVIGVDTWLGNPECWIDDELYNLVPHRFGQPLVYSQFLSNVLHRNLQDFIVPLPIHSDAGAVVLRFFDIVPDLVHIDAAHDHDSVLRDALAYWDILAPGGSMVGDDYVPGWPGVMSAAQEFASRVGMPLRVVNPKWVIRKPAG